MGNHLSFLKKSKLFFLASFLLLQGCFVYNKKADLSLDTIIKQKTNLPASLTSVDVSNNHVTIHGSGFSKVTSVKIKGNGVNTTLSVSSVSDSQITASASSALSLLANGTFNLIVGSAEAEVAYAITFTLQDGAVHANHLSQMGATTNQVLKWNGSAWAPSNLSSSQTYMGTWNAGVNNPDISSLGSFQNGDYYIVSTAGTFSGITFNIGDWAMFNGTAWEKIDNTSNVVASFQGRKGIVTLLDSDYVSLKNTTTHKLTGSSLNDLADLDLAIAPTNGQTIKWNAATSKWIASDDITGGGAGSVGSSELQANAVTTAKIADGNITYVKLNLADGDIPQAKVNGLVAGLASKEPAITAQATTKYFRGDKTFVTLDSSVVTENTNLYFTNARALGVPLTGFSATNSAITASDTTLSAFGKTQGQINSQGTSLSGKADTTNIAQTITAATVTGLSTPVAGSDAANKTYVDAQVSGGTNQWGTSSGNVYRTSGNVGIGTTSPSYALDIERDGIGSTSTSNLSGTAALQLKNTTPATSGAIPQNSPSLNLSGQYWDGSVSQPMNMTMQLVDNGVGTNANVNFYITRGLNTPYKILSVDSNGQFTSSVRFASWNNQSTLVEGFRLSNEALATASYNQQSPFFKYYSYGWKTGGTPAAQTMSVSTLNDPENGVTNPVGVHKMIFGTNTGNPAIGNELVRYEWATDLVSSSTSKIFLTTPSVFSATSVSEQQHQPIN